MSKRFSLTRYACGHESFTRASLLGSPCIEVCACKACGHEWKVVHE